VVRSSSGRPSGEKTTRISDPAFGSLMVVLVDELIANTNWPRLAPAAGCSIRRVAWVYCRSPEILFINGRLCESDFCRSRDEKGSQHH